MLLLCDAQIFLRANSHELAHSDNRRTDNYDPTKRGSYLKYKMGPSASMYIFNPSPPTFPKCAQDVSKIGY